MDGHNVLWKRRQREKWPLRVGVSIILFESVVIGITHDKVGFLIAALIVVATLLTKAYKEIRIEFMRGSNR